MSGNLLDKFSPKVTELMPLDPSLGRNPSEIKKPTPQKKTPKIPSKTLLKENQELKAWINQAANFMKHRLRNVKAYSKPAIWKTFGDDMRELIELAKTKEWIL